MANPTDTIEDMTKPPPLMQILCTLNTAKIDDVAFITAAAMNLYAESMRRINGRVLLGPNDTKAMFGIIDVLLTDRQVDAAYTPNRSKRLTPDEEKSLLNVVEEGLTNGRTIRP